MTKVKQAKFLTSASKISKDFAGFSLPEIAIVGRSNVGKSSFINGFCNNGKLAKTSSTPGRTRLVNFFEIDQKFVLVDLPGYGFAKAGKSEKDKWEGMIDSYFENSQNLVAVIMLVDIRHEPSKLDQMMMDYLYHYNIPVTVIATKLDKIKKSELARKITDIAAGLKIGKSNVFVTSAETKTGYDKVYERLEQFLKSEGEANEDLGD
ncbi:MAG: YihA family ribosome biogenesis GTP-binding protein [Clostridia bacterium]|nr:YihA family ribosome biogenesis GTP-binding protein [Clostridia bacterium]